jgi:transcriptional regulator GlxA family with amidase domain
MTTAKGVPTNVAILAFETFAAIPITGPMDVLNKSCALLSDARGEDPTNPAFKVELVALKKKPLRFGSSVTLHPHASIVTAGQPDLLLIPSVGDDVLGSLTSLRAFVPWIKECSAHGARVVSMCTGSFLLAETGLLNGRSATTHWAFADLFRRTYPEVKLFPERLIVDEGKIITAGASTAFLDVTLYLLELYCGRDAAILTAKVLLIEMGRYTQLPYTIFSTQKMHQDHRILRIQQFMENHVARQITVDDLAKRLGMSTRNFDRRFRAAVGEAPTAYLQKLRIEKAKRLLETTGNSVAEIMLKVGYADERSFRRLFSSLTELSPKAYRRKYATQISSSRGRSILPEPYITPPPV